MSKQLKPCPFCGRKLKKIEPGLFQHPSSGCFFSLYEFDFGAEPLMKDQWNLRAPAEEVQKDAKRYQWLVAQVPCNVVDAIQSQGINKDELDAAIDEAMAKATP